MRIVRIFVFLLLVAAILTLAVYIPTPNHPIIVASAAHSVATNADRIEELIDSLRSEEDSVRLPAERELLQVATSSSENRRSVINRLLKSVEDTEPLNGRHSILTTALPFWKSVSDIFGELKATEAIGILIRCIHCSNGYTGSFAEAPALDALVRIGTPAVPQLAQALRQDPNGYKRSRIALCLGQIGGRKARVALERASRSEREKDVRDYIKFVIAEMR